jgi:hypothetical protein
MGHTRLGKIPTTRRWREVVGIFATAGLASDISAQSSEIANLATSTIHASSQALRAGIRDGGLVFVYFFLTQIALSTRRPQPREAFCPTPKVFNSINLPSDFLGRRVSRLQRKVNVRFIQRLADGKLGHLRDIGFLTRSFEMLVY